MGRRLAVGAIVAAVLAGGSAVAASRWVITSTKQIKPSVVRQLRTVLATLEGGGTKVNMCANGQGACAIAASDARCPAGLVTGGGFDGGTNPPLAASVAYTEPDRDGRGWHIIMVNNDTSSAATFQALALCAGTLPGRARDARASVPSSVEAQIHGELARVRAATR
jgi:hypothetical protein